MNFSGNGISGLGPQGGPGTINNPTVQIAKQASEEAVKFQLWVSQQATSLSKLKVFHSMAKQVNDQQ